MIYLGTSGFSYPEWKGSFYPEKLPQKQFLSFYAEHFNTTEINSTFYRFPSRSVVAGWSEQVAEGFRFTLKLSQRITHRKKLSGVDEEMGWFLNGAEPLGTRAQNKRISFWVARLTLFEGHLALCGRLLD